MNKIHVPIVFILLTIQCFHITVSLNVVDDAKAIVTNVKTDIDAVINTFSDKINIEIGKTDIKTQVDNQVTSLLTDIPQTTIQDCINDKDISRDKLIKDNTNNIKTCTDKMKPFQDKLQEFKETKLYENVNSAINKCETDNINSLIGLAKCVKKVLDDFQGNVKNFKSNITTQSDAIKPAEMDTCIKSVTDKIKSDVIEPLTTCVINKFTTDIQNEKDNLEELNDKIKIIIEKLDTNTNTAIKDILENTIKQTVQKKICEILGAGNCDHSEDCIKDEENKLISDLQEKCTTAHIIPQKKNLENKEEDVTKKISEIDDNIISCKNNQNDKDKIKCLYNEAKAKKELSNEIDQFVEDNKEISDLIDNLNDCATDTSKIDIENSEDKIDVCQAISVVDEKVKTANKVKDEAIILKQDLESALSNIKPLTDTILKDLYPTTPIDQEAEECVNTKQAAAIELIVKTECGEEIVNTIAELNTKPAEIDAMVNGIANLKQNCDAKGTIAEKLDCYKDITEPIDYVSSVNKKSLTDTFDQCVISMPDDKKDEIKTKICDCIQTTKPATC